MSMRQIYHQPVCPRCRDLEKLSSDGSTGDEIGDAARLDYERAWPGKCWWDAPEEHRSAYIQVACIRFVEAAKAGERRG